MQAYPSERGYYAQPPAGFAQHQYYQQAYQGYAYPQANGGPAPSPSRSRGRPRPLDRDLSRSSTPGRMIATGRPLKSALKRTRTPEYPPSMSDAAPSLTQQISRGRSQDAVHRQRTRSGGSRMRAPAWQPLHVFLSLRSSDQLEIENMTDEDEFGELNQEALITWPHGIHSIDRSKSKTKRSVQFVASPWNASSDLDLAMVGRTIVTMYSVLARMGYHYQATIDAGNPRMGSELRAYFPRRVSVDRMTDVGSHIFEVKRGSYGVTVEKNMLKAFVLRFLHLNGFRMCGSVPMGTRSLLDIRSRREMWVFRNNSWRAVPSQKEMMMMNGARQADGHLPIAGRWDATFSFQYMIYEIYDRDVHYDDVLS
ncbi:uncharacterized protein BXZ73DRAFT_96840 [Epithele typhae]|uniref:uncharacterized protein n=1 Tax=Epithele typhae TaxID=378194 RepID=UPI0020072014|nr:uncharacterized protein BXZ73DRAFT_96840 [Epithele typhae]KAH9944354.1 hypothetical protein BXZ73DRAFT_96840 [Epithele typhae]